MNPVTAISLDLTAILELAAHLEERALDQERRKSRSALNALAPVANLEAWTYRQETLTEQREALWWKRGWCEWPSPAPDHSTTPLQMLCGWTEWVRGFYRLEREQNPLSRTLETEVSLLCWKLDALVRDLNDELLAGFAADVAACRKQLENVTLDGLRDEISKEVTCLADGCEDVFLIRRMLDEGRGKRARRGLMDEWACPRCDRRYEGAAYRLAVAEAARKHALSLVSEAARQAMEADKVLPV